MKLYSLSHRLPIFYNNSLFKSLLLWSTSSLRLNVDYAFYPTHAWSETDPRKIWNYITWIYVLYMIILYRWIQAITHNLSVLSLCVILDNLLFCDIFSYNSIIYLYNIIMIPSMCRYVHYFHAVLFLLGVNPFIILYISSIEI